MKKKDVFKVLVLVGVIALSVAVFLNRVRIKDYLMAMSYDEPENVLTIEKSLGLTDDGSLILRASHAALESERNFNEHCQSYDVEISVTGCYVGGSIYVYEINNADLDGIVESTMAHELLHAVWDRMDSGEKNRIGRLLQQIYKDRRYTDKLSSDLNIYGADDLLDELHSRVGTEFKDLPNDLEKHYANYFKDQDKVVSFYERFNVKFDILETERKNLELELKSLKNDIETKSRQYKNTSENLTERVFKFNQCASEAGCFQTNSEFYNQRNQLLGEQSELNTMYDRLMGLIEKYNALVEKYNNNILRNQELFDMMNSNIKKEDLTF